MRLPCYIKCQKIMPYIENDNLERQESYNGKDNIPENGYRIGVSFNL